MKTITNHLSFLKSFVDKGGPEKEEWLLIRSWINEMGEALEKRIYSKDEIEVFFKMIADSFPLSSIQGLTYHKPRRYAGDFELVNRIQTNYVTDDQRYKRWDEFFHSCEAPRAVRFRIEYLHHLLLKKSDQFPDGFNFLNIASGPCRDLYEFYEKYKGEKIEIDCVDHDAEAIDFAKRNLDGLNDNIAFHHTNFMRFKFEKKYDLQWSAGFFDYLSDEVFVKILTKMVRFAKPGGEIVLGNLSVKNPSRYYMMLFKWNVHHRSEENLIRLALDSGAPLENIQIYSEPLRVNLFLHVKC